MTGFEATISVFKITDESNVSSISTPSYWTPKGGEETINRLSEILEHTSQSDFELQVKKS